MLVKVPRVFLKLVLNGCVKYAKENNITCIDEKVMKEINDRRRQEKINFILSSAYFLSAASTKPRNKG